MTIALEYAIDGADRRRRIWAIFGSSSGNLVEWYDFYAYAFTALYFAHSFFPDGNQTTQLLQTAAVFAIGFLMRPIGGYIFGFIADKYGRKNSMMISVLMMCAGSLAIAALPTYATIGAAAPALLLLARMLQGLSVGGEYGMRAWGWRIPFLIGAVCAIVALFLRASLTETSSAERRSRKEAGSLREIFRHHTRAFLIVLGYTAGGSLIFYTFTTYMQKYLVNTAHMNDRTANVVMTAVLFTYMIIQPIFGAFSDRFGRKTSMLLFGGLATLCTVPLMYAIADVKNPLVAYGLIVLALAIVSFYTSISGLVKAEMFPPEVRAMSVGLAYAIANAIFGGSAEYVALWFKNSGAETNFYWYVTFMCAIALVASILMPDPKVKGYLQGGGTEL